MILSVWDTDWPKPHQKGRNLLCDNQWCIHSKTCTYKSLKVRLKFEFTTEKMTIGRSTNSSLYSYFASYVNFYHLCKLGLVLDNAWAVGRNFEPHQQKQWKQGIQQWRTLKGCHTSNYNDRQEELLTGEREVEGERDKQRETSEVDSNEQ